MSNTVAAVVVTFNRKDLLLECLDALLAQSSCLESIILVDNASSDGTPAALHAGGYLENERIDYIRLSNNTGGAGGFHAGMERALKRGFDWIWVMDDDAEPCVDALEHMKPLFSRKDIAGVASLPYDRNGQPQGPHRGWIDLRGTTLTAHRAIDTANLAENMEISFASFVGLAVPRRAVERIGLPKQEMFIKCDDLEYCTRLKSVGPIVLVPQSRIIHKEGASQAYKTHTRLGRSSSRVPIDKLWLSYFSLRNLLWIRRQHCGVVVAALFAGRQFARTALGILLYDSERSLRLMFYWHAIVDAWTGVFDNEKPRRLTAIPRKA